MTATSQTEFFETTLMMDYEISFRIGDEGEVAGANVRIFRDAFTMAEQYFERK